jgi:hypothetical protein
VVEGLIDPRLLVEIEVVHTERCVGALKIPG